MRSSLPATDPSLPNIRRQASGPRTPHRENNGDALLQAYIAAMPGWKHDVSRRLDALIVRTVPGGRKAVRWNSPWYGVEGPGWCASSHVFTRYVHRSQVRILARLPEDACHVARA